MNARELRSLLFEIDSQNMTVKELREYLFVIENQDAELEISQIRQLGRPVFKVEKVSKPMSEHAQAAKAIKEDLKVAFKDTRFSVRARSYTGGDSVNIGWTDGPTEKKVFEIVHKYQMGHFDGMIDSYEYDNTNDDIPQVTYVLTNRTCSFNLAIKISKELGLSGKIKDNGNGGYELEGDYDYGDYQRIHRVFVQNAY